MENIITSNSGHIAGESNEHQSFEKKMTDNARQLGVALVGLGTYSSQQLAPALQATKHCRLAGAASGSEEKLSEWRKKYNLGESCLYSYERFDEIAFNKDIDVVYVVTPNARHAEYVIRAAKAGKHVICEKPMATSVDDCKRMIDACNEAGVRLSMGYRLHFEPYNQEMMRLGQEELLGAVRHVIARDGMDAGDKDQWRLKQSLSGGGPLMDLGVYCIQGVIYTLGKLPLAVSARFSEKTLPAKFIDVEEGIEWTMFFENGVVAECEASYRKELNLLKAETDEGWFMLEPAYAYAGLKGKTSRGQMEFRGINQQAAQMDDFAICIKTGVATRVPGELGMRDVEILMAIYESARTGKDVELHLQGFESLVEM